MVQLPLFKRDITKNIVQRFNEKRHFIQVIIGPRQVGKTTAVHQIIDEIKVPYHFASADLPAPPPPEWISSQWEIARIKVREGKYVILALDEIQKISEWSNEVKRLWDEDTRMGNDIKLVILGSSSLLMQKGLNESLAGRFELIRFPHWQWKECRDCFNWRLEEYIYFGGYPGAAPLINDEKRWAQYIKDSLIETAISKDILLLNRVEKPALLRQLFVMACEYGGQILSYQKILGQLRDAGNTTTLAHYKELFKTAFLIYGLSKWSGGEIRRRSSSPKWLPLNTALMTAISDQGFRYWRETAAFWGRLVEVAVGSYLVNEGSSHGIETYYWREGNYEVDYVLRKGKNLIALEVKSNGKQRAHSGINQFKRKYNPDKVMIIGSGGIELGKFLETPLIEWF